MNMMQKILSSLRRAIDSYNLISNGDRIAVGVSGGKDSMVLLKALHNYSKFSPYKFEVVGITIDMFGNSNFNKVKEFCVNHSEEGIMWFFESCDLNVCEQFRCIWKLNQAGWFDNATAILIGRPLNKEPLFDYDYEQANFENFKDLKIPVVINLDIGHTSPNWTIINGGTVNFKCKKNKASIVFD